MSRTCSTHGHQNRRPIDRSTTAVGELAGKAERSEGGTREGKKIEKVKIEERREVGERERERERKKEKEKYLMREEREI